MPDPLSPVFLLRKRRTISATEFRTLPLRLTFELDSLRTTLLNAREIIAVTIPSTLS
jgi:hypothetical protein